MRSTVKRLGLVGARVLGSLLQLALTLALTRTADPATAALCLVQVSWVQFAAAGVSWGHPVMITRDSAHSMIAGKKYALRPHLAWVLGSGVVVVIVGGTLIGVTGNANGIIVALIGCATLAHAATRAIAAAIRSYRREFAAVIVEFVSIPTTLLCVTVTYPLVSGSSVTAMAFAVAQTIACGITALAAILMWLLVKAPPAREGVSPAPRARGGLHFLGLHQLLSIGTAQFPVILAPLLLQADDAAAFIVAFRVASMSTTAVTAVTGYYMPRFARAIAVSDRQKLRRLLRSSQMFGALLCAPFILIIPWSPSIMRLFGESYDSAALSYAIIAVGQYIVAASGFKAQLLGLGGHERSLVAINLTTLALFAGALTAVYFSGLADLTTYSATLAGYLAIRAGVIYIEAQRMLARISPASRDTSASEENYP